MLHQCLQGDVWLLVWLAGAVQLPPLPASQLELATAEGLEHLGFLSFPLIVILVVVLLQCTVILFFQVQVNSLAQAFEQAALLPACGPA